MNANAIAALLTFARDCDNSGSLPRTGMDPGIQAELVAAGHIEHTPHGWDTTASGDAIVAADRAERAAECKALAMVHIPAKWQAQANATVATACAGLAAGEHVEMWNTCSAILVTVPKSRRRKAEDAINSWVRVACPWVWPHVVLRRNHDFAPTEWEMDEYAEASRLNLAAAERRARKAAALA